MVYNYIERQTETYTQTERKKPQLLIGCWSLTYLQHLREKPRYRTIVGGHAKLGFILSNNFTTFDLKDSWLKNLFCYIRIHFKSELHSVSSGWVDGVV